ncbi:putative D-lactate dehydrogenase, mitochondrial isoform X3 [Convolutriloba macropyga]|uniref:putative D-lactate dehydrogenase, mitochondrial isoform X3 n=1 Tax=Convolutriloba macropyga TaxID=536237 RepID=UPI003F5237B3
MSVKGCVLFYRVNLFFSWLLKIVMNSKLLRLGRIARENVAPVIRGQLPVRNLSSLAEQLKSCVGGDAERLTSSTSIRDQYGRDESHFVHSPQPDFVAFPNSTQEVSNILKFCNQNLINVVPFGTGTGLEGGVTCPEHQNRPNISLSMTNMAEITALNVEDFDVTVQPGVTRQMLNDELRDKGLWFPVDPGADASLCGMCATSASGTNAVRYGTMRENVLNLEVVLPDGTICHTQGEGTRARKTAAGLNLTNLFVGSEGTLGVITGATLRVHGIPEASVVAVCTFSSLEEAVQSATMVMQCGVPIARMELLDPASIRACNNYSKLSLEEKHTLFFEFHGSEKGITEQAETVGEITGDLGGSNFAFAKVNEVIESNGFMANIIGHVGDGNFHSVLLYDAKDTKEEERLKQVTTQVGDLAMKYNGTCTGEHGVGLGKKHLLKKEVGPRTYSLMQLIKRSLDPNCIMNPHKVFDV